MVAVHQTQVKQTADRQLQVKAIQAAATVTLGAVLIPQAAVAAQTRQVHLRLLIASQVTAVMVRRRTHLGVLQHHQVKTLPVQFITQVAVVVVLTQAVALPAHEVLAAVLLAYPDQV